MIRSVSAGWRKSMRMLARPLSTSRVTQGSSTIAAGKSPLPS